MKKMFKLIIPILTIVMFFMVVLPTTCSATLSQKIGDVNGDAIIDSRDTLKVLEHIAASSISTIREKHPEWILSGDKLICADINEDGIIDSRDTLRELEYIAATTVPKIAQSHPEWRTCIENKWGKEGENITFDKTSFNMEFEKSAQSNERAISSYANIATVNGMGNATEIGNGVANATSKTTNSVSNANVVDINKQSTTQKLTETAIINLSTTYVQLSTTKLAYNAKPQTPTVIVKDGKKTLVKGTDYTVSYTNNINVGTGIVTIKGKGRYTGQVKKTFSIVEVKATKITLQAKGSTTLTVGSKLQFTTKIAPTNTTNKTITLSSSNSNIATVDKTGKVTAKSSGTAIITAKTTNNIQATCKITVNNIKQAQEVYDIILFTGQSNMVGRARETVEKRYNHNGFNYTGANTVDQFSKMTGINKSILNNNGKTLDFVSIKQVPKTAYEYKYNTNSFKEIDSTKKVRYGESLVYKNGSLIDYSKTDKKFQSISTSSGTNLIPQFCQTYYKLTGHKIIVVFAAHGGVPIQTLLPKGDSRNKYEIYMYEALKMKYKAAEELAKKKNLKIANRFYVIAQGETNTKLNTSTAEYKKLYMDVHKKFKAELGLEKGVIIETSSTTGHNTMQQVNRIHQAQEELIQENADIILGSSYFYDRFVPVQSDYKNCNTKVTIDENGNKLPYNEAYYRSRCSADPTLINKETGGRNFIHFTSASLSQAGMDAAQRVSKIIKR